MKTQAHKEGCKEVLEEEEIASSLVPWEPDELDGGAAGQELIMALLHQEARAGRPKEMGKPEFDSSRSPLAIYLPPKWQSTLCWQASVRYLHLIQ